MSIKLTKFDSDLFIKNQFILNVAIGVFGFLFALTINGGFEKDLLKFIYLFYFILVLFFYFKLKRGKNYISYSRHRILGHIFVSFVFFIIGFTLLIEVNPIFLYFGILFYFILSVFLFSKNLKNNENYDKFLLDKINNPEEMTLHEFYEYFDGLVNKKNKFAPIMVFLGMQVGLIIFLNGFLKNDEYFGPIFIVAVFLLIAFYILNKTFFYLMIPYNFLLKIDKEV